MSRSDCSLYVDGNGKYCCVGKVFRIGADCGVCGVTVTLANTGPVDLLVYPTGDTDDVATVHSTLEEGSTTIFDAGTFQLDLDCEALDGTDAPEDVSAQMAACCEPLAKEAADIAILCAKLEGFIAGGDSTVTIEGGTVSIDGEVCIKDMTDLIAKLCGPGGESLAELLIALTEVNTKWCEADAANFLLLIKCLEQIKANTSAITGIETSMGQVGCTRDAEGNLNGSVLVCKVTPEAGGDPEIVVWWFGYDGTVVKDYTGEYEGCTSLKALEDLLEAICKKLDAQVQWSICEGYYVTSAGTLVKTNWKIGCDKDGNTVYPNGSECPIFLESPSGDDPALPECSCTFRSSSKRLIGIATTSITATGAGTGTHNIKFDPTMGTGGVIAASLDSDIGGTAGANQICTLSGAAGAAFSYFPASLVKNGPGDYTSTIIPPTNNCEAELQAREWNLHTDGTTESAGFGVRHCTSIATDCADPEGVGCGVPIDPQPDPATVIKGPIPDESELLCLQKLKEDGAAQHEEVLAKMCDANEMASDALIKQCLLDDFWMNCVDVSEPIVPVPPINEEAVTTVTLAGDQTADYAVGSTVALYDAQGNIIGSGTVASAELDAEGNTVVTLSDAEMTGGATTAQIATVKPVLQQTVGAVKAVVKNVSILQAKRSLAKTATEGKKETATRG